MLQILSPKSGSFHISEWLASGVGPSTSYCIHSIWEVLKNVRGEGKGVDVKRTQIDRVSLCVSLSISLPSPQTSRAGGCCFSG